MADNTPRIDETTPLLQRHHLEQLLEQSGGPCVTIYMPTDHQGNQGNSNRIRFKELARQASQSLEKNGMKKPETTAALQPLLDLEQDHDFWRNQRDGLVVLYKPQDRQLRVFRINHTLPERSIVAESYHLKPLLRLVQDSQRFQVLCVSSKRVALYEGTRDDLHEVPLHAEVPRDMAEAIGSPDHVTKTKRSMYDFDDGDEKDTQLRRYFRRLDDAIWEHHSRAAGLPLVLAALSQYHYFFQDASHNQHLVKKGVQRDPFKEIEPSELGELAWKCVQPDLESRMERIREHYDAANSSEMASDDLHAIGEAAAYGRIDTLLVQANRQVGGRLDPKSGRVELKGIEDPATDDVLDDIAELVLRRDGTVVVLPEAFMPSTASGVCAIFRYPEPGATAKRQSA